MKDEFILLSPIGACAIFAMGFLLADGINGFRAGGDGAPQIFCAILFALIARNEAKNLIASGEYHRRFFVWRRVCRKEAAE